MSSKEDLRIVKTKRALVEAFSEMMREEPFEKLTVNDLCTRAGVRRATFYKHFKDKNDFLIYLMRIERQHFDTQKWQDTDDMCRDYCVSYLANLINNLSANAAFVENVISSSVKHILIESIMMQNYEDTLAIFKRAEAYGKILPASSENLTGMIIGGVSIVIYNWCLTGMKQPKDELIAEVSNIITKILA